MSGIDQDHAIRSEAFRWLTETTGIYGDVLPRTLLQQGFNFQGERIPLVSPQGIFKPRLMELPLSIATTQQGPYQDFLVQTVSWLTDIVVQILLTLIIKVFTEQCMQLPLVYLNGIVLGKYLALWPVYIVGDDPSALTFQVAVDDAAYIDQTTEHVSADDTYGKTSLRNGDYPGSPPSKII